MLNDSETERRSYDAQVDQDVLRELYLRPFEDLVRAGVWLVMAAYNRHAGTLLTEHPLTRSVLKQEWGFDGVVVSDWLAVRSTVASARSGTDLEMPGDGDACWGDALSDAVTRGEVDEPTIDDKVLRILRLAARTGALDGSGAPEHRIDVALPTNETVRLVVEVEPELAAGGILGAFGVGYRRPQPDDDEMLRRAVDTARGADAAVVVVGATDDHESEGFDRASLSLPRRQDELVAAVAAANPNTVVVINTGSVYTMPWADDVAAILWAGMPGQEAGAALSDVLTGTLEPWGRLTCTVPRADEDALIPSVTPVDGVLAYREGHAFGYRGYEAARATPRFAFGHGLGYTTWAFEAAELTDDGRALTVAVRNTGARAGREVVQVYLQPDAGCTRLVGFTGASAEPGQQTTVTVDLDTRAASRWDTDAGTWVPPAGGELRIGRSVADIALTLPVGPLTAAAPPSSDGS